jgi:hypothetical protein
MRTHACLVPNLNHVTKKTRTRTQHVQDKNPIRFYSKNETRTTKARAKQRRSMIEQTKATRKHEQIRGVKR